jgi:hypothetical protein
VIGSGGNSRTRDPEVTSNDGNSRTRDPQVIAMKEIAELEIHR